ncbi:hypothetical protein UY3_15507 [Chelonia mydas]|uniref:Uncharacterized protein n=1 Tax=Chelonia mydas TaxID=8469 RepID=M7AWI4_CHEMY|nr:hypothetical protein UY3_15507 [Chelonia mydas]
MGSDFPKGVLSCLAQIVTHPEPSLAPMGGTCSLHHFLDEITGSYDEITGSYDEITGSYDEITGSVDEITGSYDEITGSYDEITGSYDEITGSYDEITAELLQLLTLFKRFRSEPYPDSAGSNGHLQIQRMEGQELPLCDAKTNKAPRISVCKSPTTNIEQLTIQNVLPNVHSH